MSNNEMIRSQKAKQFNAYIKEHGIQGFSEMVWDNKEMISFQGTVLVDGQPLPVSVDLDDTVYTLVQVLIVPKALKEKNGAGLNNFIRRANGNYPMLKYWLDEDGNLILTVSVPSALNHFDADLLVKLLEEIVVHLNTEYAQIMKVVWDDKSVS